MEAAVGGLGWVYGVSPIPSQQGSQRGFNLVVWLQVFAVSTGNEGVRKLRHL